jgi:hypothetical protein
VPLSTATADALLAYLAANDVLYMSAHSAWSATGGNELAGGTYARLAVTWGTPSSNSVALAGTPYNVNAPAGSTCAFVGFWTALTGGTFAGMVPAGNAAGYAFSAPSSTGTLLAPGSAYVANATVCAFPTGGSVLPGGLAEGTIYYIKSPSSDSFELSATSGGSAITLTSDGSGFVQGITPESFGSAGTFTVSSGTWSLV